MKEPSLPTPFIWPDVRRMARCPGPTPDLDTLFASSALILGVVHGMTESGVARLQKTIAPSPATVASSDGKPDSIPSAKNIRLLVIVYPTCPTTSEDLLALLQLQTAHPSLEVRIDTCDLWSGPENTIACYEQVDSAPTILFGSSASFEDATDDLSHLTLAFAPEPVLSAEWQKWFDVRWLKATKLTEERTAIPVLVLPEGTAEAAREWAYYQAICSMEISAGDRVEVSIDPDTGEVVATTADGTPVETVSTTVNLPKISPVYCKLSQLLEMGHLVSVDKTTRLLPFEVSVKPKWFGLETLTQIGSVKRTVNYRISALTKEELKQLENRRTKTSELLELFSFSLADSQRWMPKSAEELFRTENTRVSTEAEGILTNLIKGDLDKFMASRKEMVSDDANRMYRTLFPEKSLSDDAINEIMATLKRRLGEAQQRPFLPQLSFNCVSLPSPQDSSWKSKLGSAVHLLLSIARYPRRACKNGTYFARGMATKTPDILKAMNLLNDPFVDVFDRFEAKDRAEAELQAIDEIEASDLSPDEKCQALFKLLGHVIESGKEASATEAESVASLNGERVGADSLFDLEDDE
jgi:hypothetical protein